MNAGETAAPIEIKLEGAITVDAPAKATVLAGTNPHDENTIDQPNVVKPVESSVAISGNDFTQSFEPLSLTVLRVKTK